MLRALAFVLAAAAVSACAASAEDPDEESSSAAATTARPSDPDATRATRTVLANLHSFDRSSADPFDHRILLGQQEFDVSNRSRSGVVPVASDLEQLAGRPPALVSYELSHAHDATTAFDADAFRRGAPQLRELVLDKHRRGILVSLVWHMRCPRSYGDRDQYSSAECPSQYVLEELLAEKSNGMPGVLFHEWRSMLDALADFLWSLKDERGDLVPVQLRPFHEMNGDWFWWGRDNSDDAYRAAWRETVTYLRDGRGLHNVLWVFSPNAPSSSPFERQYPGDAYVDVVAFDRYDLGGAAFADVLRGDLRVIADFARRHGKVAAIGEIGGRLTDETWFTRSLLAPIAQHGSSFAYVTLWRNAPWEKFIPERGDGPIADDFTRFARDPMVLGGGVHNLYSPLHAR